MRTGLFLIIFFAGLESFAQGFGGPVCDYKADAEAVAERLIYSCAKIEDYSAENVKRVAEKISFEDDAEGPNYIQWTVYYGQENLGFQFLIRNINEESCWVEESFDLECPLNL